MKRLLILLLISALYLMACASSPAPPNSPFEQEVSLQVPVYTFQLSFENLPYYQPKELVDTKGNLVDVDPDTGVFMAYETVQKEEGSSFALKSGERIPLYPVEEKDIQPFTEEGIVQMTGYNCGPAAALQTLDLLQANGKDVLPVPTETQEFWYAYECCVNEWPLDTSPANQLHDASQGVVIYDDTHPSWRACYATYTDRQVPLMELAGTTWLGTPKVEKLAEALNFFCKESIYTFADLSEEKEEDLQTLQHLTLNSLSNGYPVIFLTNVLSLKSYAAQDTGAVIRHYITAIGYKKHQTDLSEDVITVLDPNYTPEYRGKYTVTLQELLHSMSQAGSGRSGNFIYADVPPQ